MSLLKFINGEEKKTHTVEITGTSREKMIEKFSFSHKFIFHTETSHFFSEQRWKVSRKAKAVC